MKINDWWNRYVPKRDKPQKGMQGYVYRQKPEAKCLADCVCYLCRDAALIKPRLPVPHRNSA